MPGKLKSGALEPMASVPGSLRLNANEGKQSMYKKRLFGISAAQTHIDLLYWVVPLFYFGSRTQRRLIMLQPF